MALGRGQVAVAAGCVVAVLAYLAALWLPWVVAGGTSAGLVGMLAEATLTNSLFAVLYLVLTPVTILTSLAATLSPSRWYAVVATLLALADLAAIGGVGYRIGHAHGVDFAVGWYVAGLSVLAACAGAAFSWLREPTTGSA